MTKAALVVTSSPSTTLVQYFDADGGKTSPRKLVVGDDDEVGKEEEACSSLKDFIVFCEPLYSAASSAHQGSSPQALLGAIMKLRG